MNRRNLLKFLGVSPIVAPSVIGGTAEASMTSTVPMAGKMIGGAVGTSMRSRHTPQGQLSYALRSLLIAEDDEYESPPSYAYALKSISHPMRTVVSNRIRRRKRLAYEKERFSNAFKKVFGVPPELDDLKKYYDLLTEDDKEILERW